MHWGLLGHNRECSAHNTTDYWIRTEPGKFSQWITLTDCDELTDQQLRFPLSLLLDFFSPFLFFLFISSLFFFFLHFLFPSFYFCFKHVYFIFFLSFFVPCSSFLYFLFFLCLIIIIIITPFVWCCSGLPRPDFSHLLEPFNTPAFNKLYRGKGVWACPNPYTPFIIYSTISALWVCPCPHTPITTIHIVFSPHFIKAHIWETLFLCVW